MKTKQKALVVLGLIGIVVGFGIKNARGPVGVDNVENSIEGPGTQVEAKREASESSGASEVAGESPASEAVKAEESPFTPHIAKYATKVMVTTAERADAQRELADPSLLAEAKQVLLESPDKEERIRAIKIFELALRFSDEKAPILKEVATIIPAIPLVEGDPEQYNRGGDVVDLFSLVAQNDPALAQDLIKKQPERIKIFALATGYVSPKKYQ